MIRLIDIDGASKGSIQFPSAYIQGAGTCEAGSDSEGGAGADGDGPRSVDQNADESLHKPRSTLTSRRCCHSWCSS